MNKAPSFQFYAQDFLTGVMYLTNEEKGIYITMLAKQWTDGKIPKKRLGFLVGLDWEKFSEELKEKFEDRGEYLVNIRLEEEREKKDKFFKRQVENGKKGGRPSKTDNSKNPNVSQKKPLEEEDEKEEEKEDRKGKKEKTDFDEIINLFNKTCKGLPEVRAMTPKRKSSIKARIKEYKPDYPDVFFESVFEEVMKSKFLTGKNDRGWCADFDWIMNPNNFIKILEGKYNEKPKQQTGKIEGISDEYRAQLAKRLGVVQS